MPRPQINGLPPGKNQLRYRGTQLHYTRSHGMNEFNFAQGTSVPRTEKTIRLSLVDERKMPDISLFLSRVADGERRDRPIDQYVRMHCATTDPKPHITIDGRNIRESAIVLGQEASCDQYSLNAVFLQQPCSLIGIQTSFGEINYALSPVAEKNVIDKILESIKVEHTETFQAFIKNLPIEVTADAYLAAILQDDEDLVSKGNHLGFAALTNRARQSNDVAAFLAMATSLKLCLEGYIDKQTEHWQKKSSPLFPTKLRSTPPMNRQDYTAAIQSFPIGIPFEFGGLFFIHITDEATSLLPFAKRLTAADLAGNHQLIIMTPDNLDLAEFSHELCQSALDSFDILSESAAIAATWKITQASEEERLAIIQTP